MSTISKSYVIEFPLELVFSKWIAEDTVVPPAERMEIEPRIGGAYKLFMPDGGVMEGVFFEFAENEHVTYSWNWVGGDETTEVDVTFLSHPNGTEVQITHSGFESSTSYDNHASGCDSYIEGFTAHIKTGG
jgi:uncharacterized protein YndB with AHSA1/START domain